MRIFKVLEGAFAASRVPNLLIIALAQFLGGYLMYRDGQVDQLSWDLLGLMVSTTMVAAGGYIINDYYDLKIDMINRPDLVVVGRRLSRRWALLFHTILSISAIGVGFFVRPVIGAMHFFSAFFLWYFSNHLRRYFLGKMVIAVLACISLLAVSFLYGEVNYKLLGFSIFGGAIIWIRELIKDMEGFKGSSIHGIKGMPQIWGFAGTKSFIFLLGLISSILLFVFVGKIGYWGMTLYYILMIPLLIWFAFRLHKADRKKHFLQLRRITNLIILLGLISMTIV